MSASSFMEFLRPHKTIPRTSWTADSRWDFEFVRTLILFAGLFIFGIGDAFVVQSNIGNGPWSVLAQGISRHLDISMGWSTFAISGLVLTAWIPLREKPGFGTIANLIIVAIAIEVGITFIPLQDSFFLGVVFVLLGIGMIGVATSFYITCGLGAGPRDGLMTAIHHRTGVRISRVRFALEFSAVLIGALLGGTVGLGTLLFVLLIGQSIATALGVVARIGVK